VRGYTLGRLTVTYTSGYSANNLVICGPFGKVTTAVIMVL